jgi:MFS family permease
LTGQDPPALDSLAPARRNVVLAYVAAFFKSLQFFGPLAVPFFLDWLRVDYTRLFLLQAWFLFWVFALEIPTGVVADRWGRSISVGAGCLLFAVDMVFFGTVRQYGVLFVAEFLGAVGLTLMSGAEQALLYDSLAHLKREEQARRYFARCEAAGMLGLLVAFPVGSFVGSLGRYPEWLPVTFLMSAGSAVLAAVTYLVMWEPPRGRPKQGFIRMGVEGLRTVLTRPGLRSFVLNAVTISSVTFFAFWFYQPVSERAGIPVRSLGWVGAGCNLFAAIMLANVRILEKGLGLRRVLFWSAAVPGVLFIAVGLVRHPAFVVPAFLLLVGCKFVRAPILSDFINRHVESENRATVISSISLVERGITFLLYPVVGWVADRSLDGVLWSLGVLALVLAVATNLSEAQLEARTAVEQTA